MAGELDFEAALRERVALLALEDEARLGGDDPGEGERAFGVEDAGTLLADVSVDEHAEVASGRPGCRSQGSGVVGIVDHHPDLGAACGPPQQEIGRASWRARV